MCQFICQGVTAVRRTYFSVEIYGRNSSHSCKQGCICFGFTKWLSLSPHNWTQEQLKTGTSIYNFLGTQKCYFSFLQWTWPSSRKVDWKAEKKFWQYQFGFLCIKFLPTKFIFYWLINSFISCLTVEGFCHFPWHLKCLSEWYFISYGAFGWRLLEQSPNRTRWLHLQYQNGEHYHQRLYIASGGSAQSYYYYRK